MTISIVQHFKILLIRFLISILWFFDLTAVKTSSNKAFKYSVNLGLLLLLVLGSGYFYSRVGSTLKVIDQVPNAVAYGLGYGNNPTFELPQSRVLGTYTTDGPELKNKAAFPFISAKAHLIADLNTDYFISRNNTQIPFAPASTTKIMTALVALDIYKLDEVLTVSEGCTQIESTKLWLPAGDSVVVEDLIYSLLVNSAGDAACVLASSKVSETEFIDRMNKKALDLGMNDTNFTNAIGLDGSNGSHYTTISDMYLLTKAALSNSLIKDVVKTKLYSYKTLEGLDVNLENTNKLLWNQPGSIGVKTGTTSGAGEVLVYAYEKGDIRLVIIVMSSQDRFLDTVNLLEWTLNSYSWES